MLNIIKITDPDRAELDPYARLSENQLLHYYEPDPRGLFIAESPKTIERALQAGYQPLSALVETRDIEGEAAEVLAQCEKISPGIPVFTADADTLTALLHFKMLRGMLCLMRRKVLADLEDLIRNAKRIAILENVMNPTNVGAIFRSAAALGMDAVLLTQGCSDPLYRRAIRVSMGTVFQVPWTYVGLIHKGKGKTAVKRLEQEQKKSAETGREQEKREGSGREGEQEKSTRSGREGEQEKSARSGREEQEKHTESGREQAQGKHAGSRREGEQGTSAEPGREQEQEKSAEPWRGQDQGKSVEPGREIWQEKSAMKRQGKNPGEQTSGQNPRSYSSPFGWPGQTLNFLETAGFRTAALALRKDSLSLDDPELAKEEKLAIILGTEGDGLAPETIAECDYTVRIPMSHGVDSLNVAAASAVAFWELRRRDGVPGNSGNVTESLEF